MSHRIERGALPIGSELAIASLILAGAERRAKTEPAPVDAAQADAFNDDADPQAALADVMDTPAELLELQDEPVRTAAPEGSFHVAGHGMYVPRVRGILQDPDPRLRDVCTPIDFKNEQHMTTLPFLVADLRATLRSSRNGVGLAANQIGVRARVIIVDRSNRGVDEYVMVNPEIIERSKDMQRVPDGCLSVKRGMFHLSTKRAKRIRVRWRNVDGVPVVMKFQGLMAAIVQHEVDHLNGRLFTDPPEAA